MIRLKPGNKKPVLVDCDRLLAVDVDETLVMTRDFPEDAPGVITLEKFGHPMKVLPHWVHVEEIKKFKARGHAVMVWSAGGAKWAHSVVEALGLSQSVDIISGKPDWLIDDKAVTEWIGARFFLHHQTGKHVSEGDE